MSQSAIVLPEALPREGAATLEASPLDRIRAVLPDLSGALRACAEYILAHTWEARRLSIYELAERSGVSTHAVSRLARRLSYSGYRELAHQLALELGRIVGMAYALPDSLARDSAAGPVTGPAAVVTRVLALEQQALRDTMRTLDLEAATRAVNALVAAKSILIIGTGAGMAAGDLVAYRLTMLGRRARCAGDPATILSEIHLLEPGDVVIAISYHGESRTVVEGLEYARQRELRTICVTAAPGSSIVRWADIQLAACGSEESLAFGQFASRVTTVAVLDAIVAAMAWVQRDTALAHAAEVTLMNQRRNHGRPSGRRPRAGKV